MLFGLFVLWKVSLCNILYNIMMKITRKKFCVEPPIIDPYLISVCLLKSSAFSMGVCIRCTVKNAAKLAVYDEISMRVKKAHTQLMRRTDGALGFMSVPVLVFFFILFFEFMSAVEKLS